MMEHTEMATLVSLFKEKASTFTADWKTLINFLHETENWLFNFWFWRSENIKYWKKRESLFCNHRVRDNYEFIPVLAAKEIGSFIFLFLFIFFFCTFLFFFSFFSFYFYYFLLVFIFFLKLLIKCLQKRKVTF